MSPTATSAPARQAHHRGADPRIVERRHGVEMDRRRRRRRVLAAALVVASAGVGAWMLAHSALLDVDTIDVQGMSYLVADDVVAASGVAVGDALVRVNGGSVVAAVTANPWVAEASVRRSWLDGRVVVQVVERVPVAAVVTSTGDGFALVDSSGQVLAVVSDSPGLPVVTGVIPGQPGERLDPVDRGVIVAASGLPPGLASRVEAVTPGENGRIELLLNDGAVVVFGGVGDLETKIRTVQTVLATVDMQCVAVIDVGVADTAVLTRGESCA